MTHGDTHTITELIGLRRARLVRNAVLVLVVALAIFLLRAIFAGVTIRIVELSVALTLSVSAYYLNRIGSSRSAIALLFAACWLAIVMGVITTGVSRNGPYTWFPILVCLGALLGGRKYCIVMFLVSLVTVVAIWTAQYYGVSFDDFVVPEDKVLQGRFHILAQLVLFSAIVLVFVEINHNYENELQGKIDDLEQEARLRAHAEVSARQSDRAKSVFLSNMSHEIRTPLNSIIGFSSRLIKRNPMIEPKDTEALQCILRNGKVLLSLVNELLELSNIESSPFNYSGQAFSYNDLVNECVSAILPTAQQYGLQLQVTQLDVVDICADHARLHQILFNLIYFSIGQTREGSILVSLTREEEGGVAGARLLITDSIEGLAEQSMGNLFEPHNQAVLNSSRDLPISALTLMVTDRLITLHHGRLKVTSKLETNTGFDVWLPLVNPLTNNPVGPNPILANSPDS